jgi:glycosyltransferase involved in cell wall biosynthesis
LGRRDPRGSDEISVSVIVPAFNAELYIEQCLRALFEQTIDRMEVIVVDDGSTDRTRTIIETMTPPDGKSLRLISKPNGGLSSARNAGIAAARGRWIGLVDADDWVASTMFSRLVSEAESAGAEVAIASGVNVDAASGAQTPSRDIAKWNEVIASHGRRLNPRKCPDLFVLDHSSWRRIYNRAFLQRIGFAFPDGLIFEDVVANYQILLRANLVVLVDEALHFYRMGHSGQITARADRTLLDVLPVMNMVVEELWNRSASAELWANFICLQGWYMLWLCGQIADEHKGALISGATKLALKFSPRGLVRFRRKFSDDPQVSTAVELQLYGDADLLAEFARTRVASERVKRVAGSGVLRSFFVARAQVTSRLARLSFRRRLRRMGPDLGARRSAES